MKKVILILILISFSCITCLADTKDCKFYVRKANKCYNDWKTYNRNNYLDAALNNYYKAYLSDNSSIDALVGLSKTYLAKKEYKKAKDAFQLAKNIEFMSPKVNFQIAEYQFEMQEYVEALNYYLYAIDYGYADDFLTNLKVATTLEKLGDIDNAKKFYQYSHQLNPNSEIPLKRLEDIEKIPPNPVRDSLFEQGIYDE